MPMSAEERDLLIRLLMEKQREEDGMTAAVQIQRTVPATNGVGVTIERPPRKRRKAAPPQPPKDWTKERKQCPQCDKSGYVYPDFGTLKSPTGKLYPQSWCNACRAQRNYHDKERKYQVKDESNRR